MKTKWIAASAFVLGMAAAPLALQISETKTANAQDQILADVPEPIAVPPIARPNWTNPAATGSFLPSILRLSPISCSDSSISSGVLFSSQVNVGHFDLNFDPARALQNTVVGVCTDQSECSAKGGVTLENVQGQGLHIVLVGNTAPATPEPSSVDLSKQYIDLSSQLARLKLKRMHPTLLALEVETLKKELSDQEAASKLEEIQEQLKKIVSDHPESPAAQNAKRMLEGGVISTAFPAGLVPVNSLPTY